MTPADPPLLSELHGKSLLLFDDSLTSKDGHWFAIDKAIAELHAELGVETTIICNSSFDLADELRATGAKVSPVIEHSIWSGFDAGSGLFNEFKGLIKLAWHFRSVLANALRKQTFDCVLHPSGLGADLLAWCLLPRRLRGRAKRVAILTRFGLGSYSPNGPPVFARKLVFWRWMVRYLKSDFASGKFILLTDSDRLAAEYEAVSGIRPTVACSPQAIPASPTVCGSSRPLCFGALGWARLQKGSDFFQAALEYLISHGQIGDLRFVMQWNRQVFRDDGTELRRSELLSSHPQIQYIEQVLTSAEYESAMHGLDCLILPYRRKLYHSQTSGVAVEAACAGIPMIYTADTWMSDFVEEQGAGIAVADGDVDGLAQAILAMAADYPAYKALAVERSAIARLRNSPAEFARVLWGAGPNLRADRKAA